MTEVSVLERAVIVPWRLCEPCYFETVFGQADKLTGLNVPDKVGLQRCQGAALARNDMGVCFRIVSETERSVACFVPSRKNLAVVGHDDEAVGAAQLFAQLVKRTGPILFSTVVLEETVTSKLRVCCRA